MVSRKRHLQMVRKWERLAVLGRRRIMMSMRTNNGGESWAFSTTRSSIAWPGHLFVYTVDKKRFMIRLQYLSSNIFRELFRLSEEEFGLPGDGPIMLPCDAASMEYILSLLRFRICRDVERAVLTFFATDHQCAGLFASM